MDRSRSAGGSSTSCSHGTSRRAAGGLGHQRPPTANRHTRPPRKPRARRTRAAESFFIAGVSPAPRSRIAFWQAGWPASLIRMMGRPGERILVCARSINRGHRHVQQPQIHRQLATMMVGMVHQQRAQDRGLRHRHERLAARDGGPRGAQAGVTDFLRDSPSPAPRHRRARPRFRRWRSEPASDRP